MFVLKMPNEIGLFEFNVVFRAKVTCENQRIKHMFVGNVNFFFYIPRFSFAIRTSIIPIRNYLIVSMAEYSFAFITFTRIIERDAITNRTGDELNFKKTILSDPFLINCYQFRFTYALVHYQFLLVYFLHLF